MNLSRSISRFDPKTVEGKSILIVGCGAVGSRVAYELIKLGVPSFDIFDFDKIESHNVGNQLFNETDIGKYKVEALEEIGEKNGCVIRGIIEPITAEHSPYNIVFLCPDDMGIRKELINKWMKTVTTKLIVEIRISSDEIRVYALTKIKHIKPWEEASNYTNEEAEETVCGSKTSIGATAAISACLAIWLFIDFCNRKEYSNELIMMLSPYDLITRKF